MTELLKKVSILVVVIAVMGFVTVPIGQAAGKPEKLMHVQPGHPTSIEL